MAPKDPDIIWITEAMVKYGHARDWFNRRIASGKLHTYPQPGDSKVYLSQREIEALEKKKDSK